MQVINYNVRRLRTRPTAVWKMSGYGGVVEGGGDEKNNNTNMQTNLFVVQVFVMLVNKYDVMRVL